MAGKKILVRLDNDTMSYVSEKGSSLSVFDLFQEEWWDLNPRCWLWYEAASKQVLYGF